MKSGTLINNFCSMRNNNIIFWSIVLELSKWYWGKYAMGKENNISDWSKNRFHLPSFPGFRTSVWYFAKKCIFQLYTSVWLRETVLGLLVLTSTIVLYAEGILSTWVWITLWRQNGEQNYLPSASRHGLNVLLWAYIKVAECGYCFELGYPHRTFFFLWFASVSTYPTGKICSGG